jgi:hypothetical protein
MTIDEQTQDSELVSMFDVALRFNKVKDASTGEETRRETIKLSLPFPSFAGIQAIISGNDDKQKVLLQQAVQDVILTAAKKRANDDENLTSEDFPIDKVSWEAIANAPQERGVPKELWADFCGEYGRIMAEPLNKTQQLIDNHVRLLEQKLLPIRNKAKHIDVFQNALAVFATVCPNFDDYVPVVNWLNNRLNSYKEELAPNDLDNI